ncbi:uncharacterized protein FIBRA_04860 [Fibroporia radiculosa]|uniref:Uncharacterized protein n=1 Tax=Fibroporia radiculosa TaxID=599839 RepID=J4HWS1_9APHY|nr:uncharacterized protein FIBRA_04860 [Fibroporia radiculosa]CCM02752.1 predicted protein [Fibroporia radiculosa]
MAETMAQHPPAMKVGGRRLSISRPRPHPPPEPKVPTPPAEEATDYPRPTAPGEQPVHHEHHEEDVPKRERKKGNGGDEHERRLNESLYRKAEQNRPSKDYANRSAAGGNGRIISQPAPKLMI